MLLGIDTRLAGGDRTVTGTVHIVPWGGESTRKIDVDLGRRASRGTGDPDLALAPGAVVAWHQGASRVVGLG